MEMKQISLDNGNAFISVDEVGIKRNAIKEAFVIWKDISVAWEEIAMFMDKDVAEIVHYELAPCTELQFLEEYLRIAKEDLIVG